MPKTKLAIPPGLEEHPHAVEMLRAWLWSSRIEIAVNTQVWDDPAAYGIMLADISQHFSNALAQETGRAVEETQSALASRILTLLEDN